MDASVSLDNKPINNGSPKSSSTPTPPNSYAPSAPSSPNSPPSSSQVMPPPSATSSTKSAPTSPDEQAPATPMLTYNSQYNYNSHNSYYSQPSAKQKRGTRLDACLFDLQNFLKKNLSSQGKEFTLQKSCLQDESQPHRRTRSGRHRMRCRTMRHDIQDILSKSVYLTLILDVPKSDKFPIIAVKDSNNRTLVGL